MKILIGLILLSLLTEGFASTKIRVGWQIPWALQGQLVQIWKHTDILKKYDLEAEFIGRTYGPELNEIALAGEIDLVLTADQPAAVLFSKDKGWVGISRLMYNRTTTYVPPKSKIKILSDLKGKTIGVPFGAAAQRVIVENLKNAGIDPKKDVKFVNLAMTEHGPLIKKLGPQATSWDQFDALSGFDPIPAILETRGLIRVIDTGKVCSLLLVNKEFLKNHSGVAKKISAASREAYIYYRHHKEEADKWFLEEAKLNEVDNKALELASSFEPNMKVKKDKDVVVTFTNEDFKLLQKGADFVEEIVGKKIKIKDFVTNDF